MTAPFIFVGTHRIKEGQLDAYIEYFREFVEFVKENEPRLIVFEGFVDDEGTRMTIVQVHPDAESMEFHMQTIGKHIGEAYDRFLDGTERIEVATWLQILLDEEDHEGSPVFFFRPAFEAVLDELHGTGQVEIPVYILKGLRSFIPEGPKRVLMGRGLQEFFGLIEAVSQGED